VKDEPKEIALLLQALGFRASHDQIHALLAHLTKSHASPVAVLEGLVALERCERDVRNLAARTKKATLGTVKPAADFDWSFPERADEAAYADLFTLGFARRAQNVLFRGPAGVGKTMLAKGLGLRALELGMTVVFTNLSSALADLLRQESLPAVERRLRRYTSVDLLIADELGYQPIDARAVDLLFQIISRRHERASTVITTNLPYKDWSNVFPGATCLVPLVDRFTENLVTFDIRGTSYRQRPKDPSPAAPAAAKPKKRTAR
jgi:DNA replication protein DnaC